jgi:hypothetical protein
MECATNLDRKSGQPRDLQFRGLFLEMFSTVAPTNKSPISLEMGLLCLTMLTRRVKAGFRHRNQERDRAPA